MKKTKSAEDRMKIRASSSALTQNDVGDIRKGLIDALSLRRPVFFMRAHLLINGLSQHLLTVLLTTV